MSTTLQPTLIITADRVRTLDPERPLASALAVRDGVITAIGTRKDAAAWGDADTERIDLGAATVTPGFVDAHAHPMSGISWVIGTLSLAGIHDMPTVLEKIAGYVADLGPDEWVNIQSLEYKPFVGGEISYLPFLEVLGGRPAILQFFDGHALIASPEVLAMGGVTGARDFGNNAKIGTFADGTPSGYLVESEAISLVLEHKPQASRETRKRAILDLFAKYAATGYTGIHQLDYRDGDIELLEEMEAEGDLPIRLRIFPMWRANSDKAEQFPKFLDLQGKKGRNWSIDGVKLVIDGTIDNGSAWLHHPDTHGEGLKSYWRIDEEFTKLLHDFAMHGVPTVTHAIGDRAVDFVLDSIASIPAEAPKLVHRVEHVESIPDSTVPRFAELGVAASMQPMHILSTLADHSDMWSTRLGAGSDRANHAWRIGDIHAAGGVVALGSDWPVEEFDGRHVLATAVMRRRPGSTLDPIQPQQGLTPEDALVCFTQRVWASVGEPDQGVLRPGAVADFAAFELDPIESDPEAFASGLVVLTVVAGKVAHRAS